MEKVFNISNVWLDNNLLVLKVDNQLIKLELSEISDKLANATEQERGEFKMFFQSK